MKTVSTVTGRLYDSDTSVYFKNALQTAQYMRSGAILLDILLSDNEDKMIFVFDRKDHNRLKNQWREHKLGIFAKEAIDDKSKV